MHLNLKKIKALFITLSAFTIGNTSFAQQKHFTIEGKIDSLKEDTKVFLTYEFERENKVDSTLVKNGEFRFKGMATSGTAARLALERSENEDYVDNIYFWVAPSDIRVTSSSLLENANVQGSAFHDEFKKFKKLVGNVEAKYADWNDRYYAALDKGDMSKSESDTFGKEYEEIEQEKLNTIIGFVKENPNSFASVYGLMHSYEGCIRPTNYMFDS